MKSRLQILSQAQVLIAAELMSRYKLLERRLPEQCAHNLEHQLDTRKKIGGVPNPNYNRLQPPVDAHIPRIRLCMYYDDLRICEDECVSSSCEAFTLKSNKGQVLEEFRRQLLDREWRRAHLPAVHALLWVLEQKPKIPWWARLLWSVCRPKLEPIRGPVD